MAKPLSLEKRADIIKHMQAGESKKDIARWLFISIYSVKRIWNKYSIQGSYEPEPQNSGRKPLVSDETMNQVVSKIRETPDITLLELIDEFDLPISQAALSKRLIGLGFTYKKNASSKLPQALGRCRSEGNLAVRPEQSGRGKHILAG
jgi:transposase